ncbi:MAG: hypothetical protein KDI46_00500 [Alphaproteobacteria bacterium]|nr:hypothetical protein [Alphaproteobacteria bacterium]
MWEALSSHKVFDGMENAFYIKRDLNLKDKGKVMAKRAIQVTGIEDIKRILADAAQQDEAQQEEAVQWPVEYEFEPNGGKISAAVGHRADEYFLVWQKFVIQSSALLSEDEKDGIFAKMKPLVRHMLRNQRDFHAGVFTQNGPEATMDAYKAWVAFRESVKSIRSETRVLFEGASSYADKIEGDIIEQGESVDVEDLLADPAEALGWLEAHRYVALAQKDSDCAVDILGKIRMVKKLYAERLPVTAKAAGSAPANG